MLNCIMVSTWSVHTSVLTVIHTYIQGYISVLYPYIDITDSIKLALYYNL